MLDSISFNTLSDFKSLFFKRQHVINKNKALLINFIVFFIISCLKSKCYYMNFSVFSHEHYMNVALSEAKIAFSKNEVPVGAIIVCDNQIVARAHNLTETLNDATAHAEMQVLTAAADSLGGKYLRDCVLYVTLEPCVMCAGGAFWTQIGTIVYGAKDNKRGYSLSGDHILHPKTLVLGGVKADECSRIIHDFFRKIR